MTVLLKCLHCNAQLAGIGITPHQAELHAAQVARGQGWQRHAGDAWECLRCREREAAAREKAKGDLQG